MILSKTSLLSKGVCTACPFKRFAAVATSKYVGIVMVVTKKTLHKALQLSAYKTQIICCVPKPIGSTTLTNNKEWGASYARPNDET